MLTTPPSAEATHIALHPELLSNHEGITKYATTPEELALLANEVANIHAHHQERASQLRAAAIAIMLETRSLADVGRELGVTRQAVHKIAHKAQLHDIRQLKLALTTSHLGDTTTRKDRQ